MRAILASLVLVFGLALPALGQESAHNMPAPSISETEQAEPDWFQQFTFSSNDVESPGWQTEPSQSFNLAWVKGERWSVSVDLTSRDVRSPLAREEVSAGADFRITPRLSIGGELRIGSDEIETTNQWQEQQIEAGIRLRSAFKF